MKTLFLALVWMSVGFGVQAAFLKNHGKKPPERFSVIVTGAVLWPTYVAADIYLAVGPKAHPEGGAE